MKAVAAVIAWLVFVAMAAAWAEEAPPGCDAPAYLLASEGGLPKVARAIKDGGPLDILVIGSRSATVTGADGAGFPKRLEAALREKMPTVTVNVSLELQVKKPAEEVVGNFGQLLQGKTPTLVIWQTGTVDAMRSVDPDDFKGFVMDGVAALQKTGADVVLMNLQYSPRMETMISTTPYLDAMRIAAQQRNVPLFDRFAIMRHWNETGSFDLFSPVHGVGLAKRVHDCLGRALAKFILEAAHAAPAEGSQR
jgi:hypothetical protein